MLTVRNVQLFTAGHINRPFMPI